jgi:PKD repeat protein
MAVGSFRLTSGGASLIVDFSVDDATPDTNQTVTFTDLTVGATSWVWNFGDGTTSSLQNPTKSYKYAGTYTVTLAAENATTGGIETKVGFIVVTLQTIVQTNLQAYYKAPQGASPSNMTLVSGVISQWNDDTANAYHLTQGTAANRPTYNQTEITAPDGNVYGGALVDGTNDVLGNSNALFVRPDGNTVFILLKHTAVFSGNRNFIAENGTAQFLTTVTNSMSYVVNGSTQTWTAYPIGEYFLVKITFSSTASEIRINELLNRLVGATTVTAGFGFRLGNTTAPAQFVTTEIAIYNAIITGANETSVIQYFDSKFGGVICN